MKITRNNVNILILGLVCSGVLGAAQVASSDMFNLGKWLGIVKTSADEKYYLAKDVFLSAGSSYNPRDTFDHNLNEMVNLYFVPRTEPNTYVAQTIWYDPNGDEFRTIRTTYDLLTESKKGEARRKSGTTRVHTVSTKELFEHRPGIWKVQLYIGKDLVRRLTFSLR